LARGLLAPAHKNIVVVALANKLARIAWAVLARGCTYQAEAAARGSCRALIKTLPDCRNLRVVKGRWPDSRTAAREPGTLNGPRGRSDYEDQVARISILAGNTTRDRIR